MTTKLMFISSSRPITGGRARTEDGREFILDDAGQCNLKLTPGYHRVEVELEGAWVDRTIKVEESDKDSMLVVDMSATDPGTTDGLIGLTVGGRYRIEAKLGQGGMGMVYRATDERLERVVALKMLNDEFRSNEEARQLFMTEAQQMAPLSHPHLVAVHDVTTADGLDIMVTEFVEGQNLDDLVQTLGPLPVDTVLVLGHQLAVAAAYLHDQDVIHRDLKPANAILEDEGGVKLIDFGLARSMDYLLSKGTVVRGTPAYMAPEQVEGPGLSSATDIYQLGATFYELLTAELPVDGSEQSVIEQATAPPRPITDFRDDLPPQLVGLIHKCMEYNPADRPTASELADRFEDLFQQRRQDAPPKVIDLDSLATATASDTVGTEGTRDSGPDASPPSADIKALKSGEEPDDNGADEATWMRRIVAGAAVLLIASVAMVGAAYMGIDDFFNTNLEPPAESSEAPSPQATSQAKENAGEDELEAQARAASRDEAIRKDSAQLSQQVVHHAQKLSLAHHAAALDTDREPTGASRSSGGQRSPSPSPPAPREEPVDETPEASSEPDTPVGADDVETTEPAKAQGDPDHDPSDATEAQEPIADDEKDGAPDQPSTEIAEASGDADATQMADSDSGATEPPAPQPEQPASQETPSDTASESGSPPSIEWRARPTDDSPAESTVEPDEEEEPEEPEKKESRPPRGF